MAGDWIKMRTDLARDPAVIFLAEQYGFPEHVIVGLLHKLWSWADEQVSDGNAPTVTSAFLNRYIGVTDFAESLAAVGWLDINNGGKGGIGFPNWEHHMSQTAKRRAVTSRRVSAYRAQKCNAQSVTKVLPEESRVEKRRVRVSKPPLPPLELPLIFDTSECRAAWGRWMEYHREIGKPFKSPKSQQAQLTKQANAGLDAGRLIAAIENSIAQGYLGIYEEKQSASGGRATKSTAEVVAEFKRKRGIENETV